MLTDCVTVDLPKSNSKAPDVGKVPTRLAGYIRLYLAPPGCIRLHLFQAPSNLQQHQCTQNGTQKFSQQFITNSRTVQNKNVRSEKNAPVHLTARLTTE
jgi:hypothetical protein